MLFNYLGSNKTHNYAGRFLRNYSESVPAGEIEEGFIESFDISEEVSEIDGGMKLTNSLGHSHKIVINKKK